MKVLLMFVSIAIMSIVVLALITKLILPSQVDLNWIAIYVATIVSVAIFACGSLIKEK